MIQMNEKIKCMTIQQHEQFFSPSLKEGVTDKMDQVARLGKIFSNLGEKLRVQFQRIVFYFKTFTLKHGGEWINNAYLARKFTCILKEDFKDIKIKSRDLLCKDLEEIKKVQKFLAKIKKEAEDFSLCPNIKSLQNIDGVMDESDKLIEQCETLLQNKEEEKKQLTPQNQPSFLATLLSRVKPDLPLTPPIGVDPVTTEKVENSQKEIQKETVLETLNEKNKVEVQPATTVTTQPVAALSSSEKTSENTSIITLEEQDHQKAGIISTELKKLIEKIYKDIPNLGKSTGIKQMVESTLSFICRRGEKVYLPPQDLLDLVSNTDNFKKEMVEETLKKVKKRLVEIFDAKGQYLPNVVVERFKEIKYFALPPLPSFSSSQKPTQDMCQQFENALKNNQLNIDLIKAAPSVVDQPLSSGHYPLHYAIVNCDSKTATFLVNYADLQQKDLDGNSAFDLAVQLKKLDIAEEIVEKNIQNHVGPLKTVLDDVSQMEHQVKAELLQEFNFIQCRATEIHPVLIEKVKQKDLVGFLKLVIAGAEILTQDAQTGKTILHIAIEEGSEEIATFIAAEFNGKNRLDLQDKQGQTPQSLARLKGCSSIETFISELKNKRFSEKNIKKIANIASLINVHQKHQSQLPFLKEVMKRGYIGNNAHLVKAIKDLDVEAFIRFEMDGADLYSHDLQTKETLLHLAARAGAIEIVYFLLKAGFNPRIPDSKGRTVLDIAKECGRKDLVELIQNGNHPTIEARIDRYKAQYGKERANFSRAERRQKCHIAKHGTDGHNLQVLIPIVKNDLNELIKAVELEAPLNTLSISREKMFENSMRKGISLFKLKKGIVTELSNTVRGQGKSLLDIAVLCRENGDEQLGIIAYLLDKGLDPMQVNDEGETPFSMALIKGDLKAAYLMMSYQSFAKGMTPSIDNGDFQQALALMQRGAEWRDPLHVKKTDQNVSAMAYFFIRFCSQRAFGAPLLALAPIVDLIFLTGILSPFFEPTFGEKLVQKKPSNPFPESSLKVLSFVMPVIQNVAVLEMVTPLGGSGGSAIGLLTSSAFKVYTNTAQAFFNIKNAFKHVSTRPIKFAYKVGAELLMPLRSIFAFSSSTSFLWSSVATPEVKCKVIDPEKYKEFTPAQFGEDAGLNPVQCPEHAKVILTNDWQEETFKENSEKYVKNLYRRRAVAFHPDKNINSSDKDMKNIEKAFSLLDKAQNTFIEQAELSSSFTSRVGSWLSAIPGVSGLASLSGAGAMTKTAAKIAIVLGVSFFPQIENQLWPTLMWGWLAVTVGSGVLGHASQASSGGYEMASDAYNKVVEWYIYRT